MTEWTPEDQIKGLADLRKPFDDDEIDQLPRFAGGKGAPKQYGDCSFCGKNHVLPAVHLAYVGHAHLTARLLDVDPLWNWEPVATLSDHRPKLEYEGTQDPVGNHGLDPIGLWIRLTICGMTRLGYGSCDKGKNDPEKELIGDALRNAAMRFGCALDLWAKGGGANYVGAGGAKSQGEAPGRSAPRTKREYTCHKCGQVSDDVPTIKAKTASPGIVEGQPIFKCPTAGCGWVPCDPPKADHEIKKLKSKDGESDVYHCRCGYQTQDREGAKAHMGAGK